MSKNLMSFGEYEERMATRGWVIFDRILDMELIERMRLDIVKAYEVCRSIQVKNKIPDNNEFTVHHAVELGESFMEFIQNFPLVPHLESYFQGKFILNSFGGAINTRDSTSYAHRIHRDIRSFSGDLPLLLNTLIMLDDFTLDNGATYLMSGSHKHGEKPEEKEFYAKAERAIGKAGSILMFNSNVWHAAGVNKVDQPRRSMTPMFCKPFIKQQFDYPRSLGYDKMNVYSEQTLQILGYFARVPASLDEWYQPPEKRMYRPGQG